MKRKDYILAGSLFLLLFLAIFLNLQINPTITNIDEGQTQYIRELEKQYTPDEWLIEGNTVFIDTDKAYISATPHTGIGWITFNVSPKTYTGNIDLVLGFDTEKILPTKAEYFKEEGWYDERIDYTCEHEFNYTLDPKVFTCYMLDEGNDTSLIGWSYSHEFEGGNLETKTAYWYETKYWKDISGAFDKRSFEFKDLNKWYFKRNVSVVAGNSYIFRVFIQPQGMNVLSHKYWFAIKPTDETIEEAIESEHFYALDPWTNDLNEGLVSYYKMEETSGDIVDSVDSNNATAHGDPTYSQTGIIDNAIAYDGNGDFFEIGQPANLDVDFISISTWVKWNPVPSGNTDPIIIGRDDAVERSWALYMSEDTTLRFFIFVGGAAKIKDVSFTPVQDQWYHIGATANGSEVRIYINGTDVGSPTAYSGNIDKDNTEIQIGDNEVGGSGDFQGVIDELGIWNLSLNSSQMSALYNNGNGITFSIVPNINITFPINGTIYNETITQLNYTIDIGDRCWYTDDQGVSNSSTVAAGINFTISASTGWNNYTLYCNNSNSFEASDDVVFFINKSVGVNLITPIDNTKINVTTLNFSYNGTTLNTNITNMTHFIWYSNGTNFLTNTTTFAAGTNTTQSLSTTQNDLLDNNYIWTVEACGDDVICVRAVNRTFQTHTGIPSVEITFPTGVIGAAVNGTTLFLNWSILETGITNLSDHITNCSFLYNGVTEYLDNVSQCVETNFTTFTYVSGINTINFTVVEEFNFTTTNISNWIVSISEISQNWNNNTIEGTEESFSMLFVLDSSLDITTATLEHNGTDYEGSFTEGAGNTFNATATITIPNVLANTNVSFNWEFLLNDSSVVSGLTKNQSISNIDMDNCGVFTTLFLNLSLVDEETQVQLNGTTENSTIEVNIIVESLDNTIEVASFSETFNETNPVGICLNLNLSDANQYDYDATIRYTADSYANEFYHIQRGNLSNATIPNEITLFDLLSADSTEFQITFKDSSFVVVEDAIIVISREYVGEGLFKTIEIPKTDSNGQTVAHLVEKDVKYNMIVIKNGVIIGTFNNLIAFCEDVVTGSCFISLNTLGSNTPIFDYNESMGLAFSPMVYNSTSRVLSFTFSTIDGSVKTVNLTAIKMDQIGNTSACDEVLISSSGTITCTVPTAIGNATIFVNIFVDQDLKLVDYIITGKNLDSGDFGYLLLIFMVLSFALMLSSTKTGMIVGVMLGFITATLFAWIEGGIIGFGSATMWLIISGIILIWGLNTKSQT